MSSRFLLVIKHDFTLTQFATIIEMIKILSEKKKKWVVRQPTPSLDEWNNLSKDFFFAVSFLFFF